MSRLTNSEASVVAGIIFILLCLSVFACCLGTFVPEDKIAPSLETFGYSHVRIVERHSFFAGWYGCSNSDHAAFVCDAVGPQGNRVTVLACAGWPFKGVTVRAP